MNSEWHPGGGDLGCNRACRDALWSCSLDVDDTMDIPEFASLLPVC